MVSLDVRGMRVVERGMGRAWCEICGLEAARLASWFRGSRYRGIVFAVYEMEMKEGTIRIIRQQCQLN